MAQRGRPKKTTTEESGSPKTYFDKISSEVSSNQSKLSLILGALIILVVGILVFNYFKKDKTELGPAQQTQQEEQDISPEKLPGNYKVKAGDTLYLIAEKYYQDGSKYEELAKTNNLSDPNLIEVGQVLEIPRLTETTVSSSPTPSETPQPAAIPSEAPEPAPTTPAMTTLPSTKGGESTIDWGPKIYGTTYTVVEGDWLSTIAGRAYGDVFAYQKLAEANNIPNPDLIYPGQVLTIPR